MRESRRLLRVFLFQEVVLWEIRTLQVDSLLENLPLWFKKAVMERDYEAEDALKRMGRWKQVWFVTCQHLLENKEFTSFMHAMLQVLERVYGNPVDIEYTVNLDAAGSFVMNLLQCRPLYSSQNGRVRIPELMPDRIFFDLQDSSMGNSAAEPVDLVVRIDARAYYEYPYQMKSQAAEAVGEINRYFKGKNKKILPMAPPEDLEPRRRSLEYR